MSKILMDNRRSFIKSIVGFAAAVCGLPIATAAPAAGYFSETLTVTVEQGWIGYVLNRDTWNIKGLVGPCGHVLAHNEVLLRRRDGTPDYVHSSFPVKRAGKIVKLGDVVETKIGGC